MSIISVVLWIWVRPIQPAPKFAVDGGKIMQPTISLPVRPEKENVLIHYLPDPNLKCNTIYHQPINNTVHKIKHSTAQQVSN